MSHAPRTDDLDPTETPLTPADFQHALQVVRDHRHNLADERRLLEALGLIEPRE